jgi:hypothetical protein
VSSCPNSRRQSIVDSDTGAFATVYKNCFGAGFNTVAILFITEVDDISFTIGLSERVRSRVESSGRVDLSADQAARLVQTKTVHTVLWTLIIALTILQGNGMFGLPLLGTLLGGWAEVVCRTDLEKCSSRGMEMAKVLCRWLLGVVFFVVLMLFAFLG